MKKKAMNFSEALKCLKRGDTIRRKNWSGIKRIRLFHTADFLPFIMIITKDGDNGVYTATNCDILAEDWVLWEV